MISICRNLCVALALIAALGSAQAENARVTLAMTPAPLGSQAIAPLAAQPVLLCGNRWANGDYVVGGNCQKACTNGHPAFLCQTTLVALCKSCWKQLQDCAAKPTQPGTSGVKCVACSALYADCMKPFLK